MIFEDTAPPRIEARRPLSVYLLFWALLAVAALGYLGLVAARPDLIVARLTLGEQRVAEPAAASGRKPSELADELLMLRRWLTDLQRDFAQTRATIAQQLSQGQSLAARVTTVEERLATQEARAEPAAAVRAAAAKATDPRSAKPSPLPVVSQSVEKVAESAAIPVASAETAPAAPNASRIAPITTGSVPPPAAAAPIAFGPPKVTAAAQRPMGIELTGGESLEALRLSWSLLTEQHKQVLRRLAPRYRTARQGVDQPLTLVAGPFANAAEASRACAALRAKQVSCRVGEFAGNAL